MYETADLALSNKNVTRDGCCFKRHHSAEVKLGLQIEFDPTQKSFELYAPLLDFLKFESNFCVLWSLTTRTLTRPKRHVKQPLGDVLHMNNATYTTSSTGAQIVFQET